MGGLIQFINKVQPTLLRSFCVPNTALMIGSQIRHIPSPQRSSQFNGADRKISKQCRFWVMCVVVERYTDVVQEEEGGAFSAGLIKVTEKAMPGFKG